MVDFLLAIPYAKIHQATFQAWQRRDTWATMRTIIPEAIQEEEKTESRCKAHFRKHER